MSSAEASRRLPVGRILAGVVFFGYPALVWFGLTHWDTRRLALALLCVLLPAAAWRLRSASRKELRALVAVPLVTIFALALAALLDARGYVLMVPVAINAVLLVGFGLTLRPGATPIIERMARLRVPDLSAAKQSWCRLWTLVWCGFFVVNGLVALALAQDGELSAWALYNGLIAYVLIGALGATEWILRRRRFGPEAGGKERDVLRGPKRPRDARLGGADGDAGRRPHDGQRPGPDPG